MSVNVTYSNIGDWSTTNRRRGPYVLVGAPLYQNEHLGTVTFYGKTNGRLNEIKTVVSCVGRADYEHKAHAIIVENDAVRCANCDLILVEQPTCPFGFEIHIDSNSYTLVATVGPYNTQEHGPFGAATFEEALAASQKQLALETDALGPAPWWVTLEAGEVYRIVIVSTSDLSFQDIVERSGGAYAGPFDRLPDAYRALLAAIADDKGVASAVAIAAGWKAVSRLPMVPPTV